jgi:hypothetical protein
LGVGADQILELDGDPEGDTGVTLVAKDVVVSTNGLISAEGMGYTRSLNGPGAGSGAGHGGYGGGIFIDGGISDAGPGYGSAIEPITLGSASSTHSSDTSGGAGGSAIKIIAESFELNGLLNANGNPGPAGGAGGSIWLQVGSLSGAGEIRANGGSAEISDNGGGAGGRVALYVESNSFTGSVEAVGGLGNSNGGDGGPGTIYWRDISSGETRLVIDNGDRDGPPAVITDPEATDWGFDQIELINHGHLEFLDPEDTIPLASATWSGDGSAQLHIHRHTAYGDGELSAFGFFVHADASLDLPREVALRGVELTNEGELSGLSELSLFGGVFENLAPMPVLSSLRLESGDDRDSLARLSAIGHTAADNPGTFRIDRISIASDQMVVLQSDRHQERGITLLADEFDLAQDGLISTDGSGYIADDAPGPGQGGERAGGGHGGYGGHAYDSRTRGEVPGGGAYGDLASPITLGSAGGGTTYSPERGGAGGGAIHILAGAITLNGAVTASGSEGVGGVAYPETVRVMPLKVCDASGNCPNSAIAEAILWAADHGADVANLSLGHGSYSDLLQGAVDDAWERGVVVVAAAGNDAVNRVDYPAALDHVVAVGNRNWWDQRSRYSNWGAALDLVAPGGDMSRPHDPGGIFSTTPTYPVTMSQGGWALSDGYDFMSGTSMASPHVAGLAALLRAIDPARSNQQIIDIMQDSADDLETPGWDQYSGYGRINACRAVGGACGSGDDPPLPPDIWPPGGAPTPTPADWHPTISAIQARTDDTFAYYSRGWVNAFDWEDIILSGDTWAGLRFTDVALPPGAEIVSAHLELDVFSFDDPGLLVFGEAADQAADFSRSLPMERELTSASVRWNAQNMGGGWGRSPDLAPLIQAVIQRPGWGTGDPITLILRNDGGQLRFRAWDYGYGRSAPRLQLVYVAQPIGTGSPTPTRAATETRYVTGTPSPSSTHSPTPTFTPTATPTPPRTATARPTAPRTPSPTPTEIPPTATPTQEPGEDPHPITHGGGTFYLNSRQNRSRGAYWITQAQPGGEYATAWEDARFYSGLLPAGAQIHAGTTYVCLNYVNNSGSTRRVEVGLQIRADAGVETFLEMAPLWLSPSYGVARRCLRASTEAYTIGAEADQSILWLELNFSRPSTSARVLWDGIFWDSYLMLPGIDLELW